MMRSETEMDGICRYCYYSCRSMGLTGDIGDHLSVGEAYGQLGIIIGASTPWISEHWDEMGEGNL